MKATEQLHDLGQSLWLDNITRDLLTSGTLKHYIDELSVTGLTSNPTIFDQAIKNSSGLRRDRFAEAQGGQVGRGRCSSSWRWKTSPARRICSDRSTSGPTAWTAGCRSRSRRCSPTTPPARSPAAKSCMPGPTVESVDQDPRHARRVARDRRGDLRRHPDQRDAAVLARALLRRGRGIPARHRAPHRRRAQARRRVGRLGVHQPLGRRGRGKVPEGCATSSASRSPSAPTRRIAQLLSSPRWQRDLQRRRAPAAAACGPAPAPRTPRRPTSCTSRRWPPRSPSTPCPKPR